MHGSGTHWSSECFRWVQVNNWCIRHVWAQFDEYTWLVGDLGTWSQLGRPAFGQVGTLGGGGTACSISTGKAGLPRYSGALPRRSDGFWLKYVTRHGGRHTGFIVWGWHFDATRGYPGEGPDLDGGPGRSTDLKEARGFLKIGAVNVTVWSSFMDGFADSASELRKGQVGG